jgi:hypothetical protein
MSEQGPTQEQQQTPITIPSVGPNIMSTLDAPPDPKGMKAFMAQIRRDVLSGRGKPQTGP